ncbi:hypothetical protein [Spirosoma panaciterrae]|uniref:hypothetical protein n=1 Tax=Spirosoma panaciterrae TaxID=496058 RepID=UPI0003618270|nr:hypothetical protein [Spirosoma panaciterrae]
MQNSDFDAYLKLMRAYIKTLRLVFNGRADWSVLESLPQNYHLMASEVRLLIDRQYKTLPDSEWREKIIYYKQVQNQFDADYMQIGDTYCKALWEKQRANEKQEAILQEEVLAKIDSNQLEEAREYYQKNFLKLKFQEKLFRQNQSYMDALVHTRQHIDNWIKTTLGSDIEEDEQLDNSLNNYDVPRLRITTEACDDLCKAFENFIEDESQRKDFLKLLKGEQASRPIIIKHMQGSIAYVFRQAKEADYITEEKTKIRDWLVYWIRAYDGMSINKLKPSTIYDALSKDKKPAKSHRILYNP